MNDRSCFGTESPSREGQDQGASPPWVKVTDTDTAYSVNRESRLTTPGREVRSSRAVKDRVQTGLVTDDGDERPFKNVSGDTRS